MEASVKQPPKRRFGVLWVMVPLLLLAVVGIIVGWEVMTSRMESQLAGGGEEASGELPATSPGGRKSREVVVNGDPSAVAPPSGQPQEGDDLTPLGKRKPTAKSPAGAPLGGTPVERAWRSLKNSYDRLDSRNGSAARKYTLRVQSLGNQRSTLGDAQFILQAQELDEKLKEELARPENQ